VNQSEEHEHCGLYMLPRSALIKYARLYCARTRTIAPAQKPGNDLNRIRNTQEIFALKTGAFAILFCTTAIGAQL